MLVRQHFAIQYRRPIFKQPMRIAVAVVVGVLLPATAAFAQQDLQVSGAAGWGGRTIRGEHAPVVVDLDNRGKKDVDVDLAVTWAAGFGSQASETPDLG